MLSNGIHIGRRGGVRLTGGGGGWTPAAAAGLQLWFDAHDGPVFQAADGTTPAVANDDPVAYLADLSGNGRHVTTTTGTFRPLLKTAAQNSRNVLRFDASDDRLTRTLGAAIDLSVMWCMAVASVTQRTGADTVVFNIGNGTRDSVYVAKSITATGNLWSFSDFDGTTTRGLYNNAGTLNSWTSMAIIMGVYDGTNWYQYVNGVQVTTIANGRNTTGYSGVSIGNLVGGGRPMNGDLAMLMLCNVAPQKATLNAAGQYASARWGIAWSNIP